jgi:N-sulfoglucosamine sulfohydrolase
MKTSLVFSVFVVALLTGGTAAAAPPNVLFFTADDMNFDSSGVFGGPIEDLTPNIDSLASQGMRFAHAYSTVAVCQPVRQTMLCGLYPHRSGSMGFFPVHGEVRTLNQELQKAGYLISCYGKTKHLQPRSQFCADVEDDAISRHPSKLAEATRQFIRAAKTQQKPFFHNVNCYDPHRPFIGMKGTDDLAGGEEPSRRIAVDEVTRVPGFLEDLPDIRRELAGYYTNVRRLDDALGAVLAVLEEEGVAEETIVVFYGGDHGMSFPFGKSNSYENSSRGALIVRWPGVTKPGSVDTAHMVTTLDFTPTLLDMLGLPPLPDRDGRSFTPALRGETMAGWDRVFTVYNAAFGNNWLPMRCVRTRNHSYIWNAWSDGTKKYQTENMAGLTWKAMLAAAESDPSIKARTDFYSLRVPEEFYDLAADPCERDNLIDSSDHLPELEALRHELLAMMQATGDPFAEAFADRGRKDIVPGVLETLKKQYARPASARPKKE